MSGKPITGDGVAPAIGPYSAAIESGDLLFCSGQLGMDPTTGELRSGVAAQAEQALVNLGALLKAGGSDFSSVAKTTIFLADMNDFAKVNEVYAKFLGETKPARSTVAVAGLPRGVRVEIECVAKLP